jgi:hypothetical protein
MSSGLPWLADRARSVKSTSGSISSEPPCASLSPRTGPGGRSGSLDPVDLRRCRSLVEE